jgi:alpha-methylacyl-CoA racemase
VVCALVERAQSGLGQIIDSSMVEGAALLSTMFHEMIAKGQHDETRAGSNVLDGGAPFYGVYATADGEWMAVGAIETQFFGQLVEGLGLNDITGAQQWDQTKWPELRARIARAFRQRTRDEWAEFFADRDACVTPVLRPTETRHHPHHVARAAFADVGGVTQPAPVPKLSRTPAAVGHEGRSVDADEVLRHWAVLTKTLT